MCVEFKYFIPDSIEFKNNVTVHFLVITKQLVEGVKTDYFGVFFEMGVNSIYYIFCVP